jgi:hypothetical protein
MAPRPGIEPGDIVTPTQAARLLGIPAETVRTWIHRYGIRPLGKIGRWNVYDFREIAAIEAPKSDREAA